MGWTITKNSIEYNDSLYIPMCSLLQCGRITRRLFGLSHRQVKKRAAVGQMKRMWLRKILRHMNLQESYSSRRQTASYRKNCNIYTGRYLWLVAIHHVDLIYAWHIDINRGHPLSCVVMIGHAWSSLYHASPVPFKDHLLYPFFYQMALPWRTARYQLILRGFLKSSLQRSSTLCKGDGS